MEIIQGLFIAVMLPFSILAASYIVITTEIEEEKPQSIEEARNALWVTWIPCTDHVADHTLIT